MSAVSGWQIKNKYRKVSAYVIGKILNRKIIMDSGEAKQDIVNTAHCEVIKGYKTKVNYISY